MGEQLKPCPFCGNPEPEIRSNGIGDYYIVCDRDDEGETSCGATSSDRRCETFESAIDRWNTRFQAAEKARPVGGHAAITDIIRRAMLERPGSAGSFDRIAADYVRKITFLARSVREVPEGCADASAVRADFRTFLRRASEGEGVTITRYGKPIARLLPTAPSPPEGLGRKP